LSKRKLRFWYSKDDYKKEREEQEKRLAEELKNEIGTGPVLKDEAPEPTAMETNAPPVESNEVLPVLDETKLPQTEAPKEVSPKESQTIEQQTETPPATVDSQVQVSEDNQAQPESKTEPVPTINENTEATPAQTIETPPETPSTEPEMPAPIPTESPPAANESPIQLIEAPIQPNPEETSAETTFASPPVETIIEATPTPVEVENKVPLTDSVESIEKYADSLKSLLPTKAVVCIGEYPINILLKGSLGGKNPKGVLPIFVEKTTQDVIKWGQGKLDQNNIVCLDEDIDTHFWYDILPYVVDNESFLSRIKGKPIEKLQGAILVSSIWNGIGSALLPTLNNQFKELNVNSIALPILPSKSQPLDGQFNTFASMGILASKADTALVLFDRDSLESFTGVDRNGFAINGNSVTNYLLDIMLSKDTFVSELCEMSKTFGSKMFTVLLAPGVSLKLYGSLENMLNTTLLRPLFTFDISTATLLYLLIRMPYQLKDKLARGKVELAVANWFKNKADLESILISDPVYVEDSSDRIDIAMFIGGFDTATRFAALEKKVEKMKNRAVKKGSITEENWQLITKSLLE
jgi:hypothetical protein